MQVFEFHFNPKLKPELIFESFCYEPENIYEKRLGSLYMTGILKNALPKNLHFLERLAGTIKDKYYNPLTHSPEKALKEALKRANIFLEDLAQTGDVTWLGNLSFAILSIKDLELNFTKVGDVKIFLLRGGKAVDIEKRVRFEEVEPYPLKVFLNIISGKLAEDDIILVLSQDVFEFFQKENLLVKIAKLAPFKERKLKEILSNKKEGLSNISGLCLLIYLTKEKLEGKKEAIFTQLKAEFSLKERADNLVAFFQNLKLPQIKIPPLRKISRPTISKDFLSSIFAKIKIPKLSVKKPSFPKLEAPPIEALKIEAIGKKIRALLGKKRIILVLSLILILIIGFFIFQREKAQQLQEYRNQLSTIQEKVERAESFRILKAPHYKKEADLLFRESWEEISFLTKIATTLPQDFQGEIASLRNQILNNLYERNNLVVIPEPDLIFEFETQGFIPQNMISDGENLYLFNPYGKNIFKIIEKNKGSLLQVNQTLNLAAVYGDTILFLSKPNDIIVFKDDKIEKVFSLESPYPDFDFNDLSIFRFHAYFLDKKAGQIVKYPYLDGLRWDVPEMWLSPQTKKPVEANSIAIDGSVWILNKNSIDKYHAGTFQETLSLDFFPYPKELTKIFTSYSLPYLYILEPVQSRIVVLDKSGQVIKQFQSEKFNNLLDFTVSEDGETIWFLNGLKVYRIQL